MACNDDFCVLAPKIGPCPKCGGEPEHKVNTLTAWIRCKACGFCVTAGTLKEAKKRWSKRSSDDSSGD